VQCADGTGLCRFSISRTLGTLFAVRCGTSMSARSDCTQRPLPGLCSLTSLEAVLAWTAPVADLLITYIFPQLYRLQLMFLIAGPGDSSPWHPGTSRATRYVAR